MMYLFDLRKLNNDNYKIETKSCRKTTAVYGGYVNKKVILVPKDLGNLYVRGEDGRWGKFT